MADISFSSTSTMSSSSGLLRRVFSSIGRGFSICADAYGRVGEIEKLNALSDAQLAKRGLTREAIPRYVYRDMIGM